MNGAEELRKSHRDRIDHCANLKLIRPDLVVEGALVSQTLANTTTKRNQRRRL